MIDNAFEFIEMTQHLPLVYLAVGLYVVHWIFNHPAEWRAFLEALDTPGGHLVLLAGGMMVGYRMFQTDQTAGGQIITGAWSALLVLLNVVKRPDGASRATDPGGPAATTVQTTTTAVVPPPSPGTNGFPIIPEQQP